MLTHPVSGGAKWTKSYPSFDRISHPFGCLLDPAIPRRKGPPDGGYQPLGKKPCIAPYAPSHQPSWHSRLPRLHMPKEQWISRGLKPLWEHSKPLLFMRELSSASED